MRSLLLTATAVALLTAGAAAAQSTPPQPQPQPQRPQVDANADGRITWAEFQAQATQRFDRADTDKDGRIALGERPAAQQDKRGGRHMGRRGGSGRDMMGHGRMGGGMMLSRMDQNDDGFVARAEAEASAKRLFAFLDLNGDGALAGKELPMGRMHGPAGGQRQSR